MRTAARAAPRHAAWGSGAFGIAPCTAARFTSTGSTGYSALRPPHGRRPIKAQPEDGASTSSSSSSTDPLDALDSLLGVTPPSKDDPASRGLVPWWQIKPKQSAPPRQTTLAGGVSGKFISEQFFRNGDVRVGQKTAVGDGALQPPRVQPVSSYVLLVVSLAMHTTYLQVAASQGPHAAAEFLQSLTVAGGGGGDAGSSGGGGGGGPGLLQLLAAAFATGGSGVHVAAQSLALATCAAELEALLGRSTLPAVYLLGCMTAAIFAGQQSTLIVASAVSSLAPTAGDVLDASASPAGAAAVEAAVTAAAGSSSSSSGELVATSSTAAGVMAVVACLLVQYARNGGMLQRSLPTAVLSVGAVTAGHLWLLAQPGSLVTAPALLAGLVAGGLLGVGLGSKYQVTREVDIPEGSMIIPEDAVETVVVVDATTSLQRTLTVLLYSGALGTAAVVGAGVASLSASSSL